MKFKQLLECAQNAERIKVSRFQGCVCVCVCVVVVVVCGGGVCGGGGA